MYLTLGEASRQTGKHKTTLQRAIDDGRMSAHKNEHGHYQIDPAELFRVFDPASSVTPSDHHNDPVRPPETSDQDSENVAQLLELVNQFREESAEKDGQIDDLEARLGELRKAYNALPSPEDVDARIKTEVEKIELESHKAIARQTQQAEKWKAELEQRKRDIEMARREADAIKQQAVDDIARIERRAASERMVREALENRGLIARLLNRKPVVEG